MGFLDKAKAAANDLAAKADTAMASSGMGGAGAGAQTDKLFRDLGVIAYLEATDRQAPEGEHERIMGTLRQNEQTGGITSFALQTGTPPPGSVPPPPGAAAQQGQQPPPAPTMQPPPPPSWAKNDDA